MRPLPSGRTCAVNDDMPESQCPKCGVWETDYDGFGVMAHIKPVYPRGCGYCSHPSTLDGYCGICGEVRDDR